MCITHINKSPSSFAPDYETNTTFSSLTLSVAYSLNIYVPSHATPFTPAAWSRVAMASVLASFLLLYVLDNGKLLYSSLKHLFLSDLVLFEAC